MKQRVSHATLKRMVDRIVKTVSPIQVILFGSYASGDTNAHSDVDFLVVEDKPFGPGHSRRKEAAKIWQNLMPFEVSKDILVYSRKEVEKYRKNPLHVVHRAFKTGRIMYEYQP